MNKQSDKPLKTQIRGSIEEKKSNVANSLRTVAVENMGEKTYQIYRSLNEKEKITIPGGNGVKSRGLQKNTDYYISLASKERSKKG